MPVKIRIQTLTKSCAYFSAKRSQFRLASVLYGGLIPQETIQIPPDAQSGLFEDSSGLVQPGDVLCNSVTFKNTPYAKNMLVVLQVVNQDRLMTGWIKKIIVRDNKVYFLLSAKVCRRTNFRYFQTEETVGELQLKSVTALKSFRPLIPRGNEAFYVFFLCGKLLDDYAY
jgi:hypothetical protein